MFHKKMKTSAQDAPPMLQAAKEVLQGLPDFKQETIHDAMLALAQELGVKNGQLLWPLRVALSGTPVTPGGAIEIAVLLGREETLARLDAALDKLAREL